MSSLPRIGVGNGVTVRWPWPQKLALILSASLARCRPEVPAPASRHFLTDGIGGIRQKELHALVDLGDVRVLRPAGAARCTRWCQLFLWDLGGIDHKWHSLPSFWAGVVSP